MFPRVLLYLITVFLFYETSLKKEDKEDRDTLTLNLACEQDVFHIFFLFSSGLRRDNEFVYYSDRMIVRETLLKPVLDLLADFIDISKEDKNTLLEHQAKLLALHWVQKESPDFSQKDLCKAPRYGKNNALMLKADMTRLNVDTTTIERAKRAVISCKGMPPEVPLIGKIAVDMEIVEPDFLGALMTAQAGKMILRSVERLKEQPVFNVETLVRLIVEPSDSGQMARNYIGKYEDDSKGTIAIQASLHLSDLAGAMAEMATPEQLASIARISEILGYAGLQAGAERLAMLGHLSDAHDILQELPEIEIELRNDMLDELKTFINKSLEKQAEQNMINSDVYEKGQALLRKRFEQADVEALLNTQTLTRDIDLKDRLRRKIKSAK